MILAYINAPASPPGWKNGLAGNPKPKVQAGTEGMIKVANKPGPHLERSHNPHLTLGLWHMATK